ncbi:biotin transporter BioY [Rothia sp. HC945]|uniref:biotin transporter BioY n=1 Tax=Rothia sp. HC945 TaxID=3171170 RepID=UPI00264F0E18|nr:biotin transporter BioY [Kocuria sp.]MDN5618214.1 biotin transporter BioY [Kocuria sp.]MDN5655118.1 biotin transporter BioY [Kocuria sp.]
MNSLPGGARPTATVQSTSVAHSIAYIAVFAALVAVLGLPGNIPLPGLVPITAQTLGVMVAGAVLGARRGALSMFLFLALVAMGLPLLSGGRGGLGVFVGPSAGYMIAWVVGAAVVGLVVRSGSGRPTWLKAFAGCILGGMITLYVIGIPVQAAVTGMSLGQTFTASLLFLPGDLIKAVIASIVTMGLWKAYPRAFHQ